MLVAAKQHFLTDGTELVGIAIDHADKVKEFAGKYRINYPVLIGDVTSLSVLRQLGNAAGALPYTVALDRNGSLVDRHLGALTEADLRKVLASLVS